MFLVPLIPALVKAQWSVREELTADPEGAPFIQCQLLHSLAAQWAFGAPVASPPPAGAVGQGSRQISD